MLWDFKTIGWAFADVYNHTDPVTAGAALCLFFFLSPNLGHGNNHHGDKIRLLLEGILFGHWHGARAAVPARSVGVFENMLLSSLLAATVATAKSFLLRVKGQGQRDVKWTLYWAFCWLIATITCSRPRPCVTFLVGFRWGGQIAVWQDCCVNMHYHIKNTKNDNNEDTDVFLVVFFLT